MTTTTATRDQMLSRMPANRPLADALAQVADAAGMSALAADLRNPELNARQLEQAKRMLLSPLGVREPQRTQLANILRRA